MGKVEDYINTLEGQENLDPTEVVKEILKLHNEEVDTREAKIASLTNENDGYKSTIADKDGEITQWKAKNWDLVNQLPAEGEIKTEVQRNADTGLPDASSITLEDMFKE